MYHKLKKYVYTMLLIFFVIPIVFPAFLNDVQAEEQSAILKIEKPDSSSLLNGDIEISGFILNKESINKVNIYIDNELVGQAVYGITREDVLKKYPNYPGSLTSGFTYNLNSRGYNDGLHETKVEAIDERKSKIICTMKINIKNSRTSIMGKPTGTKEQMIKYFQQINEKKI